MCMCILKTLRYSWYNLFLHVIDVSYMYFNVLIVLFPLYNSQSDESPLVKLNSPLNSRLFKYKIFGRTSRDFRV